MQKLQETVDWLYGEGQSAPVQAYKDKLNEFKKIGYPVKERYRFHSEIDVYLQQFQNFAQDINDRLSNTPTLHEKHRADIMSKYTEMESYFNVINQMRAAKKTHEDLSISIDEVHHKFDAFK